VQSTTQLCSPCPPRVRAPTATDFKGVSVTGDASREEDFGCRRTKTGLKWPVPGLGLPKNSIRSRRNSRRPFHELRQGIRPRLRDLVPRNDRQSVHVVLHCSIRKTRHRHLATNAPSHRSTSLSYVSTNRSEDTIPETGNSPLAISSETISFKSPVIQNIGCVGPFQPTFSIAFFSVPVKEETSILLSNNSRDQSQVSVLPYRNCQPVISSHLCGRSWRTATDTGLHLPR